VAILKPNEETLSKRWMDITEDGTSFIAVAKSMENK